MASASISLHFHAAHHPIKVTLLVKGAAGLAENVLHVSDGANAAVTVSLTAEVIEQLEAAIAAAKDGGL